MLIVSTAGATHVGKIEGTDGVFDVPPEAAEHLLQFPGWRHATEKEVAAFPDQDPSDPAQGATALSAMDTALPDLPGPDLPIVPEPGDLPITGTEDDLLPAPAESPDPKPVLKGAALEDALTDAGLPHTGTADEKRASLAALDQIV